MNSLFQGLRPFVVVLLALAAAIAVTFGAIQIRMWWSGNVPIYGGNPAVGSPSDVDKLRVLASLASTSSVSVGEKSKTLKALSAPAKAGPTDEEKLKILQALQSKP